jgi:hypothetical protein
LTAKVNEGSGELFFVIPCENFLSTVYFSTGDRHTFGNKDTKIHGKLEQKHPKGKKMNKLNLFEAFLYLPRYPAYNVKRW